MSTRLILLLTAAAVLAACAGDMQRGPAGIGGGRNDLKGSPCACVHIPQPFLGA